MGVIDKEASPKETADKVEDKGDEKVQKVLLPVNPSRQKANGHSHTIASEQLASKEDNEDQTNMESASKEQTLQPLIQGRESLSYGDGKGPSKGNKGPRKEGKEDGLVQRKVCLQLRGGQKGRRGFLGGFKDLLVEDFAVSRVAKVQGGRKGEGRDGRGRSRGPLLSSFLCLCAIPVLL